MSATYFDNKMENKAETIADNKLKLGIIIPLFPFQYSLLIDAAVPAHMNEPCLCHIASCEV